jgi:hypothetical protein
MGIYFGDTIFKIRCGNVMRDDSFQTIAEIDFPLDPDSFCEKYRGKCVLQIYTEYSSIYKHSCGRMWRTIT